MDATAYGKLSTRELECLRLVAIGLTSKQIAARLGTAERPLSPHTVDGYLKTAVADLGADDRRHAARMVAAYEGARPPEPPRGLRDQAPGVDPGAASPPGAASATSPGRTSFPWPWRRPDEVDNTLSVSARLLWIPVLAIGLAIGFGSLASGLKVVQDAVGSVPLLRQPMRKSLDHGRDCDQPERRPERPGAAGACPALRTATG